MIESLSSERETWDELAEFLAVFSASGEHEGATPESRDPACWRQRFDWWWTENPFCKADSPRGILMRDEDGKITGFHGLIPFDYEWKGESIPGLISSIFFVAPEHRSGSMAIFVRMQKLARTYHLVDGGPTETVIRILQRFGYERGEPRKYYFYPTWPGFMGRPLAPGLRLITDPEQLSEFTPPGSPRLRPVLSRESLIWLQGSGSRPREFVAVCDEEDRLIAYVLGIYKSAPLGMQRLQIASYASLDAERCTVDQLLSTLTTRHRDLLKPRTAVLVWGLENAEPHPRGRLSHTRDSPVFYCGPGKDAQLPKTILPIEGDYSFF